MKICRFVRNGATSMGRLEGESIAVCAGESFQRIETTGEVIPLAGVKLLAPCLPSKIVAVGRNYAEHAREMGHASLDEEPLIFLKPPSSIIAPGDRIVRPAISRRVDYEGELGVVIGRAAWNIPEGENPLAYVYGYTCVNDVTARDLQKKDVQFTRGKGFDTFCPFGPWIETDLDPTNRNITTRVNGQVRQQGNTRDMLFSVAHLIRFVASIMTLIPGDLITTGTPAGVGPLVAGDVVEVEVEGIGILRNPVV
jgi:2-keto-4-pentenoate hydratase/2-oxohepta-3-ene-1,7-dioic acid hydratase in catechol pathway